MNRRDLFKGLLALPVVSSVQASWFALPQKIASTAIVGAVETMANFDAWVSSPDFADYIRLYHPLLLKQMRGERV